VKRRCFKPFRYTTFYFSLFTFHSSLFTFNALVCNRLPASRILTDAMPGTLLMDSSLLANAETVVARARTGDPEALGALYRAFEAPVYNLARRICRTTEDAEDVLQETFFEVCRSIGRYREEGSLWGWVRTIAASKALMRIRRNKYRDTDELHDEVVGRRQEDSHLRMDLEAALERLPETSRAVVWLHDVEGYTHDEIAKMMGKTPSFSKSQLARAHARLRQWLGEEVMT
jgi:RNA polymerase sigma factor (sigma-70 family)